MNFINDNFNDDILKIIDKCKEDYNLTNYEYVNLITMLLAYEIITRLNISNSDIEQIIGFIINNRNNKLQINNNSAVYNNTITYACNSFFSKYGINKNSYNTIMNNWFNGYYFHAFNGSFIELFNSNGIDLNNKPWDSYDLDNISKIYGKKVFGYTNGNTNALFLSSSLSVSPYYSLSTPTFFRRFIENDSKYLNCYLNRDYNTSLLAINDLCDKYNVSQDIRDYTINFFNKYWNLFNKKEYPAIILLPRNNQKEYVMPDDDVINNVVRNICNDNSNFKINSNIDREVFEIFDYESISIIAKEKKKEF